MKILHSPRFVVGIIFLAGSILILTWLLWYFPPRTESFGLTSLDSVLNTESSKPKIYYSININWTPEVRAGDHGYLWIRLEPQKPGIEINEKPQPPGEADCSSNLDDIYCLYNPLAEARLDIPGIEVSPPDAVTKSLQRNQNLEFTWNFQSVRASTYQGTIWFYLNLVPKAGGEMIRRPLLAKHFEMKTSDLLGLSAASWRWFCGIAFLIGALMIWAIR